MNEVGPQTARITLRPAVPADAAAIGAVFDAADRAGWTFVHPAHAGRGIGPTLLAAAHDALRAAGCREVFLFTHEQNERTLAVYTAAGYRPVGSIRASDFRGTHLRELRHVKPL
ncbi:MAG: GNAT family N-acetyltransferase [Gaiellaceae bacterium]